MQPVTRCYFDDAFYEARRLGASDIHLAAQRPVVVRVDGKLREILSHPVLTPMLEELYEETTDHATDRSHLGGDLTRVLAEPHWGRVRLHWTRSRATLHCSVRLFQTACPDPGTLGLSPRLCELVGSARGLVLIVGSTGSGKSTTLAALLRLAAQTQYRKIITLEDPIEYDLSELPGSIEQRAVGSDIESLHDGVLSALRSDPDIIAIGEARSSDDCNALLRAAETGHFVLATMHAADAASAIDRMLRAFPSGEAAIARTVLADVLLAISAQKLVARPTGGRAFESELLLATDAVRAIVRDGKCYQLRNAMTLGGSAGMNRFTRAGSV